MKRYIVSIGIVNLILILCLLLVGFIVFNKQSKKIQNLSEYCDDLSLSVNNESVLVVNKNTMNINSFMYFPNAKNTDNNKPDILPVRKHPENRITALYGMRLNPFTGQPEKHKGIDIVTSWRGEILATMDGYVYDIYESDVNGLTVVIFNELNGTFILYAHLHETYLKLEQKVSKGEVIARQGGTGEVTGDHLHYEIWMDVYSITDENDYVRKVHYDPLLFIKGYYLK